MVAVGVTFKGLPVPIEVPPPHEPAYHVQEAPVPRLPPFTVSVTSEPAVTVRAEADTDVGEVLGVLDDRTSVATLSHPAAFVRVVE